MSRIIVLGLAALLLSPVVSYAGTPAVPSSTALAPAQPSTVRPVWPDNGIAQRKLDGASNMFIEDDHGHWHAWVLSSLHDHDVKALDFFSGKVVPAKLTLDRYSGDPLPQFADSAGKVHTPFRGTGDKYLATRIDQKDKYFSVLPTQVWWWNIPGEINFEGSGIDLRGDSGCSLGFYDAEGGAPNDVKWRKVLVYHVLPNRKATVCSDGYLSSTVNTVLDLGDGTYLITADCFIFRVRKSDLLPVGAAPGLHIFGLAAFRKAVMHAEQEAEKAHSTDYTDYLAKALHITLTTATACVH